MIIYFYDLKQSSKILTKKELYKLKRKFYYYLKKSNISKLPLKTKSVFIAPNNLETKIDNFFLQFKDHIEVYKTHTSEITPLF